MDVGFRAAEDAREDGTPYTLESVRATAPWKAPNPPGTGMSELTAPANISSRASVIPSPSIFASASASSGLTEAGSMPCRAHRMQADISQYSTQSRTVYRRKSQP